jgi:tetratricopeptide (TPR) repeat protein
MEAEARIADLDRRARELLQAGRVEEAAGLCREALETGVEHEAIRRLAGLVAFTQGDLAAAVARYEAAIALRPDHAGADFNLGNALGKLGRLEEAAAA